MNLESVIENDEQKIIFLKAIILGINYGRTDNADVYRHNILTEIKKLNEKINANKKSLNNSLEKNKQSSSFNFGRDYLHDTRLTNQRKTEEQRVPLESTGIIRSFVASDLTRPTSEQSLPGLAEKYDNNISNLENQKKYTINLINNLTASNYQYNYSKINLLKSNLMNIDKEIEKNKINILKHKEKNNIKPNIIKNSQTQENFEQMLKTRENIRQDFNKENNIESEKNNKEENIEDKLENKNLSGELEKTLSSLTSLLS